MTTEDDKTTKTMEGEIAASSSLTTTGEGPDGVALPSADDATDVPGQFGYRRFVYAAYFGVAMLVAFIVQKAVAVSWARLAQWKPQFGEPRDEAISVFSVIVGVLVAIYYWRHTRTRELAEDVASELAKVTWPSRKEVVNNTMVVIVTTLFATVFFTLMDRFWSFVTNWVYGT